MQICAGRERASNTCVGLVESCNHTFASKSLPTADFRNARMQDLTPWAFPVKDSSP
jgi:hypothetical protein